MPQRDLHPDLASLLAAHNLSFDGDDFDHGGYSGARLTRIERGDDRFILKRVRLANDWLMRWMGDTACREAQFAVSSLPERLPASVRVATVDAARDGDGFAILARDISDILVPDDGSRLADGEATAFLTAIAEMHAALWDDPLPELARLPLDRAARFSLTSPRSGQALMQQGIDIGFNRGWQCFERLAPAAAVAAWRRLDADPQPLVRIFDALPRTLLHHDLRFGNVGFQNNTVYLLDWQGVAGWPVASDIAWMLAVNSSRMPSPVPDTLDRYAAALERALGPALFARARWPEQRHAIMLAGLLLYGWGKALDAEDGRPDELAWWCEGAARAAQTLGL